MRNRIRVLVDPRASTPAYDVALLGGLRRQGEDAELFTADFYPDPYSPASTVPGRRYYFLRISRFLRRRYKHIKPVLKFSILLGPVEYLVDLLRLAIYCVVKRPTLHIVWPFVVPADVVFLAFARLIGLRVVYTVHNPLPHDKETAINKFLYGLLYRLTNELIFHCQTTVDDCKAVLPISEEKVSIIPCGVFFADREAVPREEARKRLGLPQDETTIVFVGHVKPYKGLDILLRAVAAMKKDPTLRLVVCANFRFANMADYAELIDAARAKVSVDILDEVPTDERFVLLTCAADLFVLPYRSGTASMSGMTAVRFGTPLIVTNVGALPEMLGEDLQEYVVKANDEEAFRLAMERFLALDAQQRKAIGEALAQRGKEHFGWDTIARQTITVYNICVDRSDIMT